jgi:hypothetical protein
VATVQDSLGSTAGRMEQLADVGRNIDDPHEFDKAVCWEVVSTGKDRDPMWRCICAFFFAAAMEVDTVQRLNGKNLRRLGAVSLTTDVVGKKRSQLLL